MTIAVLYHSINGTEHCPDGFAAALAFYLKYGNSAKYIPVCHDNPPPYHQLTELDEVILVDFSYPRDVILELSSKVKSVLVIDHHRSAEKALSGLDNCIFDMNKSGAVLAYEYVFPGKPIPMYFQYVQDRDLWRNQLENTVEINLAIRSFSQYFYLWEGLLTLDTTCKPGQDSNNALIDFLLPIGKALYEIESTYQRQLVTTAFEYAIGGREDLRTWVIKISDKEKHLASDICHQLIEKKKCDFVGTYYQSRNKEGKPIEYWSLRSKPSKNVRVVAESFGGGGHDQAAGFQYPPEPCI